MKLNENIAAVVTGGASGLGEATVRGLVGKGVKVAILDFAEERGEKIAAEIGAVFCKADVTSEAGVEAAFEKARAAIGQERILVNCAGTGNAIRTASRHRITGEIRRFPTAQFERIVQINLIGTFRCISQAAAGMMTLEPLDDGERGVIINTASIAAIDGQIGQAAYSASKAAIVGMSLPIARDLMSEGIRVNAILPGVFETPMMMSASPEMLDALGASVPFPKRLGAPDEFAGLVLHMIENGYLNGERVRLDGAIRFTPG